MKRARFGCQQFRWSGDEGFSLFEVLVAIVVITIFLTGTLQIMAVNALYKLRTERLQRANQLIQDDIETVKSKAAILKVSEPTVACSTGYANELKSTLADSGENDKLVTTEKIFGKNYELRRIFPGSVSGASPHRLKIEYEVKLARSEIKNDYQNQETVLSTSSFEVIPDAAYECP